MRHSQHTPVEPTAPMWRPVVVAISGDAEAPVAVLAWPRYGPGTVRLPLTPRGGIGRWQREAHDAAHSLTEATARALARVAGVALPT